jgi:hypothetical protein
VRLDLSAEVHKLAAVVAGAMVCFGLLIAWHVPRGTGELGSDIRLVATPPGELIVKPAGAFVSTVALRPGDEPATGHMTVRNISGQAVNLRVRGLPSTGAIDRYVHVRYTSGGNVVASGTLARMRRFGGPGLDLAPREQARVDAALWLDRRVGERYKGRIVDVTVELRATPEANR